MRVALFDFALITVVLLIGAAQPSYGISAVQRNAAGQSSSHRTMKLPRIAPAIENPDELVDRWDDSTYHENRLLKMITMRDDLLKLFQQSNYHPGLFSPDPLKCSLCMNISKDIWFTLQNGGKPLKEIEEFANITCHILLIKDPARDANFCADLVDGLMQAIHMGLHSIASLHFNYSMMACADTFKVCTVDCCVTKTKPEQVHISFTSAEDVLTSTSMQAAWVTQEKSGTPTVQWWATQNKTDVKSAAGESRTYNVGGWIGWVHGAVMTGLNPDTEYTYKVGSSEGGWSDEFTFYTLPSNAGTEARPLRVATFADMGVGGQHADTIAELTKLVQERKLDFILHTGDISYSDADAYRWDRFMREMEPVVARLPYMTAPGNHELFWNFTEYKNRFFMPPTLHGAPTDAMYYSFSVGQFRFVHMDSETWWNTPRMDPVQVAWADRVLKEARDQNQFIWVGFHRPLYCSSPSGKSCNVYGDFLRSKIEDVLHRHQVAVVHTGHVHNFERTFPVRNLTKESDDYSNITSFVHFVNGAAGCTEGLSYFDNSPQPDWSAMRFTTTGFLVFELHFNVDRTEAHADARFVSSVNGTTVDSIHITQTLN